MQEAYDGAVQDHVINESGYTPHDLGTIRYPDEHGDPIGETASAGDVAQLALWLGTGGPERGAATPGCSTTRSGF